MELASRNSWGKFYSLAVVKSFLIWSFTLIVCLLVVGFPLVVLMVTAGSLMAVVLQSVLPVSAVLVVAGGIIGANLLVVFLAAAMLTLRGIHPQEVSWLRWLHGDAIHPNTSVYATCPLTCHMN